MKHPSVRFGALLGLITGIPLLAFLYLGQQVASLSFAPLDLFDWLARELPGGIVTAGIDAITDLVTTLNLGPTDQAAKRVEQLLALGLFLAVIVLVAAAIAWALRRKHDLDGRYVMIVGVVAFFATLLILVDLDTAAAKMPSAIWNGVLFLLWGFVIGRLLAEQRAPVLTEDGRAARRELLKRLAGGSAGLAVGAWGIGRLLNVDVDALGAEQPLADLMPTRAARPTLPPASSPDLATATTMRDRIAVVPGTRPELTPNEEFYRIDINSRSPVLSKEQWVLEVSGLFDSPRSLTLEELTAFPTITQPITLSCISNRIGGDLIGTSNWTGLRLRDLLRELGLQPEAQTLLVEAADGFFETVVLEDMMDPRTLLVYGMNGQTLPVEHGFPLRIYIPNRYGMKQPKWITSITALPEDQPGYWVLRGWSKEARPQIVSVIDSVAVDRRTANGLIPIGGIAWAGDRGIQKVEVQIDDGEWHEATLRTPPLSPLTWIQWRFDWAASPGRHTLQVRATDGTGALQIEERRGTRPDGATGLHSRKVSI